MISLICTLERTLLGHGIVQQVKPRPGLKVGDASGGGGVMGLKGWM